MRKKPTRRTLPRGSGLLVSWALLAALLLAGAEPAALPTATAAASAGESAASDRAAAEKTTRDFMEAGKRADHDAFLSLLTEEARAQMASGAAAPGAGFTGSYTVGSAVIEGDSARVPVQTVEQGVEESLELHLRREGADWKVFGISMRSPDQPEFFLSFEHPEAILEGMAQAMGEGLQQGLEQISQGLEEAFGGGSAEPTPAGAVDLAALESSWMAAGSLSGQPAREALAPLAREIGFEVDWSEAEPSAERPVTLSMDGLTRLEAIEEICRQAGAYPVYADAIVRPTPGTRPMPVAFGGPFLLEVTDLREYVPHASGRISLALRALGQPAAIFALMNDQSEAFEVEEIADAAGENLLDPEGFGASSGTISSGPELQLLRQLGLVGLLRDVTSIDHVRAGFRLSVPTRVDTLRFDRLQPKETRKTAQAAITLASVPEGEGGFFEFTFTGIDLDRIEFVPRDAAGNALEVTGRSGSSFGDEGTAEIGVGVAPARIDAYVVAEEGTVEESFLLRDIPLPHAAEMPPTLTPARFPGEAPVTVEISAFDRPEDEPATVRASVANESDKAIRRLNLNLVYVDRNGTRLDDWPQDFEGPAESGDEEGPPILVEAGGRMELELEASFMPEETSKVMVEVRGAGFMDGSAWEP